MNYHAKSINDSFELLNTDEAGLTSKEAKLRIQHYGENILPEEKKKTLLKVFNEQFKSPIIYILLIAAVVSFSIKEYIDGSFILAVLFINAIIGAYQEYTAGKKADSLKKIVKTYVNVLRDNNKKRLLSNKITVGDIILFESGSKVPADVRLIKAKELLVDESLLTGESTNILKDARFLSDDEELPVADRKNMLYAGSFVSKGRAKGIVTAIGENTEIGKVASLIASSKESKPPLILRMEEFSLNIAKIIGMIVVLLVFLGIYHDMELKEIFFLSVALAVSSIPEGLPVAITVALSAASNAMSKRNVIVRKLSSIEGLGSCTLIASDKTGTLTQNKLSVKYFITAENVFDNKEKVKRNIYFSSILCNEASYHLHKEKYEFMGDQVDVALAKYVIDADQSYIAFKKNSVKLDEIPYEPENCFSAAAYDTPQGRYQYVKGSPEVIIGFCDLAPEKRDNLLKQIDEWAGNGFRNIALAFKKSENEQISLNGFTYLGFAAIIDPLRKDVKNAVKVAQHAGIEVAMITGDHPNTAYHIAKELEIAVDKDEIINGKEIQLWIEKGEKKEEIANKRVFARVTPEHKQKIVKAFQDLGHFVSVTGDGVNDAAALKYAHIGISMGKSGTDVARESSDLILADDSFKSIVNGIEEGRVAYDNIRKVIHLLISTGFAEIILIILSMLFLLPLPLLPVQLLWLNLVTNGIQDVALGMEKAEPGILNRKPRNPKEPIFNKIMIRRVVVGGLYMGICAFIVFYTVLKMGYPQESARNITLLLMVLFENVHIFNSRSETHSIFKINHLQNFFLLISVMAAQLVHIASLYIPFMQSLLGVKPIKFEIWITLLLIALILIAVMEMEKRFLLHKRVP